jgi:hypothetical protein
MKLVYIEWVDCHSGREWKSIEDLKEECECLHIKSVGWLVKETKENILIVPTVYNEEICPNIRMFGRGDFVIPKCSIKKRKNLSLYNGK